MNFFDKKIKFPLRNILIWLITFILLIYLFLTTDFNSFLESIKKVNKITLFSLMFFFVGFGLIFDTSTIFFLLKKLNFRTRYLSILFVKAASYLINILNYLAATTMMAYFLKTEEKKDFFEKLYAFILLSLIDFFSLSILVFSGLLISDMSKFLSTKVLHTLVLLSAIILISIPAMFTILKVLNKFKKFSFFTKNKFVSLIANTPLKIIPLILLLRTLFIMHYIFVQFIYMKLFAIPVPLKALFLFIPVLTIIAIIPISISGLGTTQIAMRIFYTPYISSASYGIIDAFSTATIVGTILIRAFFGLIFIRKI